MAEHRIRQEIRIIVILAVLAAVVYGAFAGITLAHKNETETNQIYYNQLLLPDSPDIIRVEHGSDCYELKKENAQWIYTEDTDLPISRVDVTFMNTTLKELVPERIITDGGDYFSEFGLNQPSTIITMYVDGVEKVYRIGNYNSVLGEFYLSVDESSCVYLISVENTALINRSLLDLVADPYATDLDASEILAFGVKRKDGEYMAVHEDGAFTVATGDESFQCSEYRVLNISSGFSAAEYSCSYINAGEAELEACGLTDPVLMVEIIMADGSVLQLAAGEGNDGSYYLNENGGDTIYKIGTSYFERLMERTSLETLRGNE